MRVDSEFTQSLDSVKKSISPFSQPSDQIGDYLPAAKDLDCVLPAFDVRAPAQSRLRRGNQSKRIKVARLNMNANSADTRLVKLDQRIAASRHTLHLYGEIHSSLDRARASSEMLCLVFPGQ